MDKRELISQISWSSERGDGGYFVAAYFILNGHNARISCHFSDAAIKWRPRAVWAEVANLQTCLLAAADGVASMARSPLP